MNETEILNFIAGGLSAVLGVLIYAKWELSNFYKQIKLKDGTIITAMKSLGKDDEYEIFFTKKGDTLSDADMITVRGGRIKTIDI